MTPVFKNLQRRYFVGKRIRMSYKINRTGELWKGFMPESRKIRGRVGEENYSIEKYPPFYFEKFDPSVEFEKWAAVEVAEGGSVPGGMELLTVEQGDYVVFLYRGAACQASETFRYIFSEWFPASGFSVDDRPHMEVMGKKYDNISADSEEELWIPVKPDKSIPR